MKVGLALSGGGIKGIAHAGVLNALEDNGIKIDIIGGTSSGSMVASLYAAGYTPNNIYNLFKEHSENLTALDTKSIIKKYMFNHKLNFKGLKNGIDIERIFDSEINQKGIFNINDIKMPIVLPAVDLIDCKEYIFTNNAPSADKKYITDISIGKAIRASSSFTAIFEPCEYKEHSFIDGGTLNNIPIEEVKKQGADIVIGVKFNSYNITKDSNIMDMAMRTIDIMGERIAENGLKKANFVLNISTEKTGLFETKKQDICFENGYNAVVQNIDKIKNIFNKI